MQGVARFSYAGLPPGKSKLDYLMTVKGGQATFLKYASAGEAPQPSEGPVSYTHLDVYKRQILLRVVCLGLFISCCRRSCSAPIPARAMDRASRLL